MSQWIDISVALRTGMVHWPGDIPVRVQQTANMQQGDVANLRTISMSAHTGTHMDAPLHFVDGGLSLDTMPFTATVGRARVIEIDDDNTITRAELEKHEPQLGERVLFKTRNSGVAWAQCRYFLKNYVALSSDAARYLVECGVRTIGVDYLSIGPYGEEGFDTHRVILAAGIWVIEGLNLANVSAGEYELICLPLKIAGGDGAPARAILRRV
jgi:arylformamidase